MGLDSNRIDSPLLAIPSSFSVDKTMDEAYVAGIPDDSALCTVSSAALCIQNLLQVLPHSRTGVSPVHQLDSLVFFKQM